MNKKKRNYFKIFFILIIPFLLSFIIVFIFTKIYHKQIPPAKLITKLINTEKIINYENTNKKVVAFTFDADMTPYMFKQLQTGKVKSWYNQDVINVLKSENVPATLFLSGMWIETYATTTKELSNNPLFELGNHSYSHGGFTPNCYNLHTIPESNDILEVKKTDELLSKYATTHAKLFRFPGICFDKDDVQAINKSDYVVVGGDVYSGDGFQKDTIKIIRNVLKRVKPGSIVIFHMHGGPNASQTAKALPTIIQKLKSEGYTFVKVTDLLKRKN